MRLSRIYCIIGIVFIGSFLAGCRAATPSPTDLPIVPTETKASVSTQPGQLPTDTPEPVVPNTLVICTQDEPQTLYLYGGSSRSMWSVLEAVYDGPFDTRGFSLQPVILEKIPTLTDGDAIIKTVSLQAGDPVVDVNGELVTFQTGVKVQPSGCSDPDCAVTWDGVSPISVDQLVVTFKLKTGLLWSDGQQLKASDSVFSYIIASDPNTPTSKYLTDRTYSYKAVDDRTVEWTGLPGFYEQRFGAFFWLPLPEHTLGLKSAEAILSDPTASRSPLGWGPYVIQEWVDGDHITLTKNINYFRSGEGLPYFETLVYRFVGQAADGNLNGLLAGECDVIDQNSQFLEMVPDLLNLESGNRLKMYVGQGPEWEHLDFGIRPSSFDNGYQAETGDRPDLFGDVRTRQAFALCIDRQSIIDQFLYRRSDLPDSYLPSSHPLYFDDLPKYEYNPDRAAQLLNEVGWKDSDNDPSTPRAAEGINNVPDGTLLSVTYLTSEAPLRAKVSQAVAQMLNACGVQVQVQPMNTGSLFGPGPDGPVFGRKFDLVQFSWEAGTRPNCLLYSSAQIPGVENNWIGVNVTGLASAEYDKACADAYWTRPEQSDYGDRNRLAQEQFIKDIPAIPLYFYPKITLARADLCGFEMDVTARSILWNLEEMQYGAGCD